MELTSLILLLRPKRPRGHERIAIPLYSRGELCPNRAEAVEHITSCPGSQLLFVLYRKINKYMELYDGSE